MSAPQSAPIGENAPTHVSWRVILVTALVLGGLWALDSFVLRTTLLVSRRNQSALTPLYAFWEPRITLGIVAFVALAVAFVRYAPRYLDPERTRRAGFVAFAFVAALALPFSTFVLRLSPADLGSQPSLFGYGDFLRDADRIVELVPFLRDYVAMMPTLSLHAQHYPPGPIVVLHVWSEMFGDTSLAAGIFVLLTFAVGVWISYRALLEFTSERAARQATLLIACAPMALDQACTSMDAVFFTLTAGVWWLALRTFRPGAHIALPVLLGCALFAATCFSFSALPVGLAVLVYALVSARRDPLRILLRLLAVGVTYLLSAIVMDAATGFSIWHCFVEARYHAMRLMGRIVRGTPRAGWGYRTYGNLVAFAIGVGLGVVPAVVARMRVAPRWTSAWPIAASIALAVMVFAPIYYMETERIWVFALPWVAAIAVGANGLDDRSVRRLIVAALIQALVMQSLLFTFW